MSYVIYHTESTRLLTSKPYKTLSAAKAALTRYAKKYENVSADEYSIAETQKFYNEIEKMVKRKNLLSGKEYMEPINTPSCCSPASEVYWSM